MLGPGNVQVARIHTILGIDEINLKQRCSPPLFSVYTGRAVDMMYRSPMVSSEIEAVAAAAHTRVNSLRRPCLLQSCHRCRRSLHVRSGLS